MTQSPIQSAPPRLGSQESVGSSTHLPAHLKPANPPHLLLFLMQTPGVSHASPQGGLMYGSLMHISSAAQDGALRIIPPQDLRLRLDGGGGAL